MCDFAVLLEASSEDSCCLGSRVWFRLEIARLPASLRDVRMEEKAQQRVEAMPWQVISEVSLVFGLWLLRPAASASEVA